MHIPKVVGLAALLVLISVAAAGITIHRGRAAPTDGTKDCLTIDHDTVSCRLSLAFSTNLSSASAIAVTLAGNATFSEVTYVSGCLVPPEVRLTPGTQTFLFVPAAGGCGDPVVFDELLTVVPPGGGPLAQTVTQTNPDRLEGAGELNIPATTPADEPFALPLSCDQGSVQQQHHQGVDLNCEENQPEDDD